MSTKIYDAYRLLPGHDLFQVLPDIATKARKRCQRELLRHCGHDYDALQAARTAYRQQHARAEVNDHDLDVELAIHRIGQRWYLRAFAGSGWFRECLRFLDRYAAVEDYHYQNQTDPPARISPRAWAARKRTWAGVWRDGIAPEMLVYPIVSRWTWHLITPKPLAGAR